MVASAPARLYAQAVAPRASVETPHGLARWPRIASLATRSRELRESAVHNSPKQHRCELELLGLQPRRIGPCAAHVYLVRLWGPSEEAIVAKLYVPEGAPPGGGWPVSVWCHGFGDPATDYYRWPLVGNDWAAARGELAGAWAQHGVVTLALWMPGAGPSEPLGLYSPLSLERNAAAVRAGFQAMQAAEPLLASGSQPSRFNHQQQILRTDCIATPLGVEILRSWREFPELSGLKVWVADDLPPSPAHHFAYMTAAYDRLPPRYAACCYLLWARCTWGLAQTEGWPLDEFLTTDAQRVVLEPVTTPIGPLPGLAGRPIFSSSPGSLVARTLEAVRHERGAIHESRAVRDWLMPREANAMLELGDVAKVLQDPFYRRYLAASDPFFAENVAPFTPGIPLVAVGGRGESTEPFPGLPTFDERFEQMTRPKLETLRSWGWDMRLERFRGQSFADPAARDWALRQVREILSAG